MIACYLSFTPSSLKCKELIDILNIAYIIIHRFDARSVCLLSRSFFGGPAPPSAIGRFLAQLFSGEQKKHKPKKEYFGHAFESLELDLEYTHGMFQRDLEGWGCLKNPGHQVTRTLAGRSRFQLPPMLFVCSSGPAR